MVDLLFYLYGFILLVFFVEVGGMILFSFVKKIFQKADEAKKELENVQPIK